MYEILTIWALSYEMGFRKIFSNVLYIVFFFSKEERIGDDIGFKITSKDMSDLSGHKDMIRSDIRKFNPVAKS